MQAQTRVKFDQYLARIAQLNGVPSAMQKFTVTPSVQQTLESKIQENADFLKQINIVGVDQQNGEKLGLMIVQPQASTTDTTQADRTPTDVSDLVADDYACTQTNYDSFLTYAKLDMWAKFPDFQTRIRNALIQRQALDRIMVGFNGVSRAASSNKSTHPLLQDVNVGWLQKYRANAASRVMSEGAHAGHIRVGAAAGNDYTSLDALVYDATNHLIDPWWTDAPGLVALCGRALMADKYFPLINQVQRNEDILAWDILESQKRLGGLPAIRVPYFPPTAILITFLVNLSIYYQNGTRRRLVMDWPKRDRIENYESSNDAYVVENYGSGCLVENIVFEWSA
jgi:P2 family phage major capsid protein